MLLAVVFSNWLRSIEAKTKWPHEAALQKKRTSRKVEWTAPDRCTEQMCLSDEIAKERNLTTAVAEQKASDRIKAEIPQMHSYN